MCSEDQLGGSGSGDPTAIGYEMHRRQLADMTAAILEDRDPVVRGEDGLPCLEVIAAVYRSAETGLPVSI
jgi:predicted dehydrogenase